MIQGKEIQFNESVNNAVIMDRINWLKLDMALDTMIDDMERLLHHSTSEKVVKIRASK